jgi:cytochrome c oxidase cbb3-type subunit 3
VYISNGEVKMCFKRGLVAAALLGLLTGAANRGSAQEPPQAPRQAGGFVPGQKRPPGDPAEIARGKTLFDINCRGCHGADLRGGDLGGPNLLRSQVALKDLNGELIVPIIHGSRKDMGMPAIGVNDADAKAVATYVRSVIETIGRQGTPPSAGREPPSVLVGNASEGKSFFAVKCASCHSVTGDLQGIATKIADPKTLQTTWVAGGGRSGRRGPAANASSATTPAVVVTPPSGESVEGHLVRIDDFLVSVEQADGTVRTFRRNGDVPKIVTRDPMKGHKDLLTEYTDKDIHDVTAYLVTLK